MTLRYHACPSPAPILRPLVTLASVSQSPLLACCLACSLSDSSQIHRPLAPSFPLSFVVCRSLPSNLGRTDYPRHCSHAAAGLFPRRPGGGLLRRRRRNRRLTLPPPAPPRLPAELSCSSIQTSKPSAAAAGSDFPPARRRPPSSSLYEKAYYCCGLRLPL